MGSMNLFQVVNYFLSFLLIIVKNNMTSGMKNEDAEWIQVSYTYFPKKNRLKLYTLKILDFKTSGGYTLRTA